MSRTAVVLFNLGGPSSLETVEPFLFNLFSDRAIIGLPNPLRWAIARLIAKRRGPVARHIYAQMDNASPLLPNTQVQAEALAARLGDEYRVFIAMRYWHPFSAEAAAEVKAWGADRVVLLPLYPQFSSTTTGSSLEAWQHAAKAVGFDAPTSAVCCYPTESGFIAALADELRAALAAWPRGERVRILLSAHGLPKRIVARGDPYQFQVEATAAALRDALGPRRPEWPELDWVVCYQSRVGPMEWLQPATDAEIRRAGAEGIGLLVLPIAFVSEHSETLVELDIEYGHLAKQAGVPIYRRLATVGAAASYISGLASLVKRAARGDMTILPDGGSRRCPEKLGFCACAGGKS
jgi:protoporphyrin/coproporphyrin ferrochelatase